MVIDILFIFLGITIFVIASALERPGYSPAAPSRPKWSDRIDGFNEKFAGCDIATRIRPQTGMRLGSRSASVLFPRPRGRSPVAVTNEISPKGHYRFGRLPSGALGFPALVLPGSFTIADRARDFDLTGIQLDFSRSWPPTARARGCLSALLTTPSTPPPYPVLHLRRPAAALLLRHQLLFRT